MSDWRPIETAPRDGKPFVIVKAGDPDSYEVGRYQPMFYDRYEPVEEGLYQLIKEKLLDWTFNNFHRATHWTPLPEPPIPHQPAPLNCTTTENSADENR